MNKLTYILIALLFVTFSCRKKTEREVIKIDSIDEYHCYNNSFDEDELGLDCGGQDCEPCQVNAAPCTLPDNEMYIYTNAMFETKSFTSTSIDSTSNGLVFYAYTDGSTSYYLKLSFLGKPDITRTYSGQEDGSLLGQYKVNVIYNSSWDYEGTGDVYVSYENGAYTIESCDFSFSKYGQNAPQDAQWFKVTFEN